MTSRPSQPADPIPGNLALPATQQDHAAGRHSIVANTVVSLATQLGMWCFAFVSATYVPRRLGAESMGRLSVAISWWAIAMLFLSFGTEQYIAKRIARQAGDVTALLEPAVILRVVVGFAALVGLVIAGHLLAVQAEQLQILFLVGLTACIWSLLTLLQNVIQGLERLSYMAPGNLAEKAIAAGGSVAMVVLGRGVVGVAFVFAFAAAVNLGVTIILMQRRLQFRRALHRVDWPTLFRGGLPFFWNTAAITLYAQSITILLSMLTNNTTTGYFTVALRLFGTSLFIPVALLAALFPVFSRQHVDDAKALQRTAQRSLDILVLLGIPLAVGLGELANPLIQFLYGHRYVNTAPIMSVFGAILMATYLNVYISQLLMAMDRQKVWMMVSTLGLVLIVPVGIACIVYFRTVLHNGGIGAAVTLLITESIQAAIGFAVVARSVFTRRNLSYALRCAVAAAVMGAVLWSMPGWSLFVRIIVGAVVYTVAGVVLRTVNKSQLRILQNAVSRRATVT